MPMLLCNLISLYLIVTTVATIIFAVQIRTLSGASYARTVFFLSLAICFYIIGYTMELNSSSSAQIIFWNRIEYIGIPFVAALWMTTTLIYTGHFASHKKLLLVIIFTIPVVTFVLRFTNNLHHLYFASVGFTSEFGRLFFVKKAGPWMYVQLFYSALMVFSTLGQLIWDSQKSRKKQSGKMLLLVVASIFAIGGLVLMEVKPYGIQIDYMALCLPVTCIIVILAISRYDLLETKSLARSKVFEASSDAILLINRMNRVIDYNESAGKLFAQINIRLEAQSIDALFGKRPELLASIEKSESSVVKLSVGVEERYYSIITEKIDGAKVLYGWIKIFHDVTEICRLNEALNKQAMTDELSVLSNRRAFIKIGKEWITRAEKSGGPLHMIMLDLDHFKGVNDQYGHSAGDVVIREFGQVLKKHFDVNCQVARLGGEEFAVLLVRYSDAEISRIIDAFLKDAEKHIYTHFGNQFHVTVSVGITSWKSGQALEEVMRRADTALYQSKAQGRNCVTAL